MQIVIDIPDAPMQDYSDLVYKIHGMAASEGLFDDKRKSQRALALKVVVDILRGIVKGTLLPKGHGRLIDADKAVEVMRNEMCGTGYQGKAMYVLESDFYTLTIISADDAERSEVRKNGVL